MKFARYLEETQTPEWKKAYIDYRGLKKRITAIRRAHQNATQSSSNEDLVLSPTSPLHSSFDDLGAADGPHPFGDSASFASGSVDHTATTDTVPTGLARTSQDGAANDRGTPLEILHEHAVFQSGPAELEHSTERTESSTRPTLTMQHTTVEAAALQRSRRGRSNTVTTALSRALHRASSTKGTASGPNVGPRFDLRRPIPLMELLPQLTPVEHTFFNKLDEQLDKVESFYCERERDMRHRANLLKEQLQELSDHRRAFYDAHPTAIAPYAWLPSPIIPNIIIRRRKMRHASGGHPPPTPPNTIRSWTRPSSRKTSEEMERPALRKDDPAGPSEARVTQVEGAANASDGDLRPELDGHKNGSSTTATASATTGARPSSQRWKDKSVSQSVHALFQFRPAPPHAEKKGSDSDSDGHRSGDANGEDSREGSAPGSPKKVAKGPKYDPEEYQHAKKQLKKAVLECYRGLEVLNNYRVCVSCEVNT
ncbi:SPX domain-containing protein [Fomes fomentarius]|nr:SPX domain-containing protein [Fomes fomentarius]